MKTAILAAIAIVCSGNVFVEGGDEVVGYQIARGKKIYIFEIFWNNACVARFLALGLVVFVLFSWAIAMSL